MEGAQRFISVILLLTVLSMLLTLNLLKNEVSNASSVKIHTPPRILFWTAFFGDNTWGFARLGDGCNVTCTFSKNRSHPLSHDALIFHGRDPHRSPPERAPNQVYIMFLWESPFLRGGFIRGNHFYNWSMTYSRKSNVFLPYFLVSRIRNQSVSANITEKSLPQLTHNSNKTKATTFWVVSHCRTAGRRREYVDKLRTYIKVDIYGRCAKPCPEANCHHALAKTGRYKFYLSFENAICKDYITEKAMRPLLVGVVPIVYGGMSTEDYESRLPPGSYIDVRNFKSPKHLSQYLVYLDGNNTAYLEYFQWRRTHKVHDTPWCALCQALHNSEHNSMAKRRNINWDTFWNQNTDCDSKFITKVLG